jgi:hypothetical protein
VTTMTYLKLVLTPLLIGLVSLAERRWGSGIAGWLTGLPLTSGPISIFLNIQYGNRFAADAAVGTLLGLVALGAFCVTYAATALTCRRWTGPSWAASTGLALTAFVAVTYLMRNMHAGPVAAVIVATVWLAGVGTILHEMVGETVPQPTPLAHASWEILARMVVATAFVLILTAAASYVGPQLSGLLSPLPIFVGVLAAFAHHTQGVGAALTLLRGVVIGSFAFAGFFLTVALLLSHVGATLAYSAAVGSALSINALLLEVARRLRPDGRGAAGAV